MLIVIFLSGCSGPMQWIIEGQIDRLIAGRMAKALNLYWGQERELKLEIPALRLSLAPEVDLLKQQAQGLIQNPVLEEKNVLILYQSWQNASLKLNPFLAKWMAKLDSKQVEKMFQQLDEENKNLQNEIQNPKDEMFLRRFELVLGELTEPQKALILQNQAMSLKPYQRRLKRRLESRQYLQELYPQNLSETERAQHMTQFFNQVTQNPVPHEEWVYQQNLIRAIAATLTTDQKDYFIKQLQRFLWLLDTLLQPESSPA